MFRRDDRGTVAVMVLAGPAYMLCVLACMGRRGRFFPGSHRVAASTGSWCQQFGQSVIATAIGRSKAAE